MSNLQKYADADMAMIEMAIIEAISLYLSVASVEDFWELLSMNFPELVPTEEDMQRHGDEVV